MNRLGLAIAKSSIVVVAGLGALMASLLVGMWVVVLSMREPNGVSAALVFGIAALGTLSLIVLTLKRLHWTWRAVAGTLLVTGSLLALPQASCAVEPAARAGC